MNFGLSGAAQSFQRFIDMVLRDITVTDQLGKTRKVAVFAYIDDLLLASKNEQQHKIDLEAVLHRLNEYNLKLNVHKCQFFVDSLEFLGHKVSSKGLEPLPSKVSAISEFPLPKNYKQLRRFLGMINFYHRFLKHAAEILAPLNALLTGYSKANSKKLICWEQHPKARKAFDCARNALANATMLHYPSIDGELAVFTDASDIAVGGVLNQWRENEWVPLGFFSRKLQKRETLLSAFARELLAVYLSLKYFYHWLEGNTFTV